jgi:TPR repeat protein
VPQDCAEAVRWTRRAADQGDASAQCSLAASYAQGLAVPQDPAEAIRWYQRAADQGDATGQKGLGYMYEHGQGVPQNYTEATRWYGKAAEQADAAAQFYMGYAYRWGRGVPLNYAEAARWYRKAAEQGDAAAQWYLGNAYGSGQGVPRDPVEAVHWRLKVIGHAVIHCTRRIGWTPWVAIMLCLASFAVWRHANWLSWALMAAGATTQVLHVVSGTFWSGLGRVLVIAIFTVLSATCAFGAVMTAVHGTKPGSDRSQPPAIS